MQKFLISNRMGALMTILVLTVGSISIIGTTHMAKADQVGKVCVFFACGNANITGGTSSSSGGGGGGGQPTPTTGTIIVTKAVKGCATGEACPLPESFTIKITGTNPSPSTVNDDGSGTTVTIDPGDFAVAEAPTAGFSISFSGDCDGKISAGDTKKCTVINTKTQPITGKLTVIKEVDNTACPTGSSACPKNPGDFTIQVLDPSLTLIAQFPGDAMGKDLTLPPGTYTVSEAPLAGYVVTFDGACTQVAGKTEATVTIAGGDTLTCKVHNTFRAG